MGRPTFVLAVSAVACVLALPLRTQQPRTNHAANEAERCAPGRWYTEGGNCARNASTANQPLLRRPLVAWRQKVGGKIVGEPLVWDQHVVLGVRVNDKQFGIEARRLSDGTLIGQRALNATGEPWPTLWSNEIVWRGADGLELVRIGKKGVELAARMPKAKTAGPPLRIGTRIWAAVDGHVTCMRATDFRMLWRSATAGFVGPLSISGGNVHGLRLADPKQGEVVALDCTNGSVRGTSAPIPLTRAPDRDVLLQIGGSDLLLRFGSGHFLDGFVAPGKELNAARLRLPLGAAAGYTPAAVPLAHAMDGRHDVGTQETDIGKLLGMFEAGKDGGVRLDASEVHRPLADAPPVLAGGVMYLGACAVDVAELRMLWRVVRDGDRPLPAARGIPAGRTLLLADASELVALREDSPEDPVAVEMHTALRTAERTKYMPVVDAATAAGDIELAADVLARCRELEADEKWALDKQKVIEARAKEPKLRIDAARAAAARATFEAASARALDDVHSSLAGWSNRSDVERRHALRVLLRLAPGHAGALDGVRKLLPKDLTPSEPFLALDWLDYVDATSATKVGYLEVGDFAAENDPIVAQSKQQLLEWRGRWRKDLKAVQSQRLLLFTPITQPGSLAKALAAGELVCETLEAMFAGMPAVRTEPRPMLVFLYPDRDEYLAEAKKAGFEDVEWTAGFYSDFSNELVAKSRLYVPSDDVGFLEVLPTLAHELTHQWLRDRCPAFQPDPAAARFGPKAFWIVEGFAGLIEQFRFDIPRRRAELGTADLQRADLVASASPVQLHRWDWLAAAGRIDFERMRARPGAVTIPSSVHLAQGFKSNGTQLFYAQSAMLCRYLFEAEQGRHRKQLLDYVIAYYTGKLDQLDFEKAFGAKASDLAPKVIEYSRALLN